MEIKPYKQTLTHSCLVSSFLMILQSEKGIDFKKEDEQKMALKGSQRSYSFYVVGVSSEIAKEYKVKIKVFVDNKFFNGVLEKSFSKEKGVSVEHKKITLELIRNLLIKNNLICHIDTHGLGDYSHSSHFIVIEKAKGKFFTIIDPWTGGRKNISEKTLEKSILELKNNVKMCPLLFLVS